MVLEVLRSGVIAQGPVVKRLEDEFASLSGVKHVVAVNNGTTALIAAVNVLDLEPGDEVITSPFTFVATLNAIIAAGATARFADIGYTDFNVDPQAMAAAITPRTKVLLPVHLYGQCADMDSISTLATEHDLHLIEDAAQAHAANINGRAAGTWGIGCFSLYATKNITSAEGGLISTNDDVMADRLRVLRNQGMRQRYQYEMAGNNYRLTDLQAAVCVPQLRTYEANVATRQRNAAALSEGLLQVPGITTPAALPGRHHVWHQYTILIEDGARLTRDKLIDELGAAGVGCGIYYPKLVFDYECYLDHPQVIVDSFPVATDVIQRCVSLPVHQFLTNADIDRIVSTVSDLMEG
ncbi:MAG: DegT/DnrJ/EryC1/StrS family aminotransferase [Ilumatobacteraceae bacterium]